MGLIKAGIGAVGGVLADQWKEFFYCDAMDNDVLVVKGRKRTQGRSSNTKGEDNVISNGSGIAVADGQCMIIVDQGQVVEFCAQPGEFIYDTSTQPSVFEGDLGEGILRTFQSMIERFTYGGDTGRDQRVYYFNTKELVGNKFGTPNPVPFRVVDQRIGMDLDVSVRCSGLYSYQIVDPLLFYTQVCGNVEREYTRQELDSTLKGEFISALYPAMGKLSQLGLRPNQLAAHHLELEDALNEALSHKWGEMRGLKVVSVALTSVTLSPEDQAMIQRYQKAAIAAQDPAMGAGLLIDAQAAAMENAAKNTGGAMTGFMGMGMARTGGGVDPSSLYALGTQKKTAQKEDRHEYQWECACGALAQGNFCQNCGAKKPEVESWTCRCGAVNQGNFCQNCGAKKPAESPQYRCNKCGWQPQDPAHPPKFCPECGDPFHEDDME